MGFKCGIIGLPNVGKSTLFNALTATAAAEAANYPFCTIEPNIGKVSVPDERLVEVARIANSAKVIGTQLEFVDIAGLVRGASKGEGLGNQFLGHIREVDAIIHVLRCFEDQDITHVEGQVDPLRDAEIISTELILADIENLERREANLLKKAKTGDKEAVSFQALIQKVKPLLEQGSPARTLKVSGEERLIFKQLNLLTSKPVLYACNVRESEAVKGNNFSDKVKGFVAKEGSHCVVISAAIEAEISSLSSMEERKEFLLSLGLQETGLAQVIREGYSLLDLLTFFTVGPKEARAWTIFKGAKAPQAAGVIHSDFERGFICAETLSYQDYITYGGEQGARSAGKMRQEGRDYLVQDGDIFHFRFNV
jgi:GTP-binding protein YchF